MGCEACPENTVQARRRMTIKIDKGFLSEFRKMTCQELAYLTGAVLSYKMYLDFYDMYG